MIISEPTYAVIKYVIFGFHHVFYRAESLWPNLYVHLSLSVAARNTMEVHYDMISDSVTGSC